MDSFFALPIFYSVLTDQILTMTQCHVNCFATELLLEIFNKLVEMDCWDQGELCLNLNPGCHPALVLSQICPTWRVISIDIPALWATFEIQVVKEENLSDEGIACMKHFVELFLQRSGEAPLDFVLALPPRTLDEEELPFAFSALDPRKLIPVIRLLYTNTHRWRNVSLVAYESLFLNQDIFPHSRRSSSMPSCIELIPLMKIHIQSFHAW
ncbi:hypothetical protein D9758_006462 [Tetrapyrgos nigripes]|uniref:F-box domain-containing protein n=1 Tax=Tetrapyrgos nigripes TaxID=182062 RepID=A0A8H5GKJ1_9AGAR|nr:hypothetical protein D9758_006462 [Tetrapyrgos nigripes]